MKQVFIDLGRGNTLTLSATGQLAERLLAAAETGSALEVLKAIGKLNEITAAHADILNAVDGEAALHKLYAVTEMEVAQGVGAMEIRNAKAVIYKIPDLDSAD